MFTGNSIDLATLSKDTAFHVERDCQVSYVGKIPSLLERRLVPCIAPHHIEGATGTNGIAGIVTTKEHASLVPQHLGLIIADHPVYASLILHEKLCDLEDFLWKHFETRVHPTAKIHPTAVIAERDVEIGANTNIGPGSVIQERSIIKDQCNIGVDVVVGLDALEIFQGTAPRRILKQAGGVFLDTGVTAIAKCTLVRATFGGFTRIGEGSILDTLIHLAHDCQLGKNVTLVACSEISGRCELGDNAYVGPNASIRNGIKIGADAVVSMGSVVTRDVSDNEMVSGNFAVPHRQWLDFVKTLGKKA